MTDTHRKRMRELGKLLRPVAPVQNDSLLDIHFERMAQMDLRIQENLRRLEALMKARVMSGSGLRMADLLRKFFTEYNTRFSMRGAEWLPSSFNILEAFFPFRKDLFFFDLTEEDDYTFSLLAYMDWYTKGGLPEEFQLVSDSLREGVAHSYNVVGDAANFLISGDKIEFIIVGITLIKRGPEIVALLLAGQREANPSIASSIELDELSRSWLPPEKAGLRPDPRLTSEDRLLEGMADFARVLVATRLNVTQNTHDVRYIMVDKGPAFSILTDDPIPTETLTKRERDKVREQTAQIIRRYEPLFSAFLTLLYLPVYIGEHSRLIAHHEVATALRAERWKKSVRAALREFGPEVVKFDRSISSLSATQKVQRNRCQRINAPELQFASSGYWRPIGPYEAGEDPDGKTIFGKTWVHEQTSWVQVPAERVFAAETRIPEGADPGHIYVMRVAAHAKDVYKVGLSRRAVEKRADELSGATAAPTEFLVIAQWAVGNCGSVERAIHEKLGYCRINKRREFFRAPLEKIISVIEQIMMEEA